MSALRWEYVAHLRLMICLQVDGPLSDAEWDPYADELVGLYRDGRIRRVLVVSDAGQGPNARQRKKLHHKGIYEERPVQTAVVTQSLLARGIVTAMSWFTDMRAFGHEEMKAAFEYLSVPSAEWETTLQTIARLRCQPHGGTRPVPPVDLAATIDKLDELARSKKPPPPR